MEVLHRISFNSTSELRRELARLGVTVGEGEPLTSGFVTFVVSESHESWPALRSWVINHRALDIASTTFSSAEISAAHWLELVPDWHHGYPQPRELDFGYLDGTYDISAYCSQCGIGKKQKASFQMKGEPKWGRRGILQLNWVFDEYFVTPEVWSSFFKPHGIACLPVLNTKAKELKTVVQLTTSEHVMVDVSGMPFETCSKCGRVKYLPHTRGFFPTLLAEPGGAMAKTHEYFGSGASAHRGVLLSQAIVEALNSAGVRGASFRPVADG
jgi:hypothetical protein